MISDEAERRAMERDVAMKHTALNDFIDASQLSISEISLLTTEIAEIAKRHNVLAAAEQYFTGSDGEAAIICDVICKDADLLSDMDIEVATHLAISDTFAGKNITAWYRGRDRSEVGFNE